MKKYTKLGLALVAAIFLAACNENANTEQINQAGAFDRIVAFAENGKVAPTKEDYLEAGIFGVNSDEKVAEVNEIVENSDPAEVDTQEELQAIVNDLGPVAQSNNNVIAGNDLNSTAPTTTQNNQTCNTCQTSNAGKTCNT